jgi:antitoxin component YwqK of YwqJK toxin-antitoxin module
MKSRILLLPFLASLLGLAGCEKPAARNASDPNPVKAPLEEVNFSEVKMEDELWLFEGKPFTGVVVNYADDGKTLRTRWRMKNGQMHGLIEEWYPNGTKSAETNFVDGKRHGENRYWYQDGNPQKLQIYEHGVSVSEEIY